MCLLDSTHITVLLQLVRRKKHTHIMYTYLTQSMMKVHLHNLSMCSMCYPNIYVCIYFTTYYGLFLFDMQIHFIFFAHFN